MRNRVRWVVWALALALCVLAVAAQAEDWQSAYLAKLKQASARRVIALVSLSGSEAPELLELTVNGAGTASMKVYGYKAGKVAAYDCQGFNLDGFSVKNYSSMKLQLRSDAKGTPCLHVALKGGATTAWLAFTCPSQGTLEPVIRVVKTGGSYQVDGEKVSDAQFEKLQDQYEARYVKRGAVLPSLAIAGSAAPKTIGLKLQNLCAKYESYTTLKGIKLSKTKLSLVAGKEVALGLSRSPASAIFQQASWASSDKSVATVDQSGTVTGVSAGKAMIKATVGRFEKTCQVTVTGSSASPTGLTLDVTAASLVKGETLALTATPIPLGIAAKVSWSSSKPKVATVDGQGVVRALSKGTAVITAKTANGKTATCKVVVNDTGAVIVDISQHNDASKMDWAKIAQNVDLLILRCGVTRTETKPIGIGRDDNFEQYVKKCNQYDIPFGVYYYGKCDSVEQAKEEARFTWEVASPHKPLFYVYDAEEACLNKAKIEAYMTTLKSLGAKKTGYYIAHHRYSAYKLDTSMVDFIWLPNYGKNTGRVDATPAYPCDMHQYTSKGTVPGIAGYVDLNRLMGGKSLAWFTSR